MSVIATTTLDNDEDLMMSRKLWDDVRNKGFDRVGEKSDESSDSDEEERKGEEDMSDQEENEESSDDEIDEKQQAIAAMADQMEDNITRQKEYQMSVDRRMVGKEMKKKALIE